MTDIKLYPCTHTECENEVPFDDLIFCEECGCPQCKEHDVCGFCDEYVPICEGCDKEFEEDLGFEMPYCIVHGGDCDERWLCPECLKNWKCSKGGQFEMEFQCDESELPF